VLKNVSSYASHANILSIIIGTLLCTATRLFRHKIQIGINGSVLTATLLAPQITNSAAEELTFGKVTTGASDDLKKVTNIVYSMIKVRCLWLEVYL
jgi:hypothetical protein